MSEEKRLPFAGYSTGASTLALQSSTNWAMKTYTLGPANLLTLLWKKKQAFVHAEYRAFHDRYFYEIPCSFPGSSALNVLEFSSLSLMLSDSIQPT